MPLPTPRLPMASTSCLEFLGVTVSGEVMGASEPGCPFFLSVCDGLAFGSVGGIVGGVGGGACVPVWFGGGGVAWPAGSCDWASATPEKSSAAKSALKSFGEVGCMILASRKPTASIPPRRYTREDTRLRFSVPYDDRVREKVSWGRRAE